VLRQRVLLSFSHKGRREEAALPLTIRRQCSHAARINLVASGVRNAECADSVTFGSLVSG